MGQKEIDDIAASGLPFDICYDDDGQPIVGDSEGAEFIRRVLDDRNASSSEPNQGEHGPAGEPYVFDQFVFLPEGSVPQDPTGETVSYTILRQSGYDGIIGALFVAPNGATGFVATTSSGDVGKDWQQEWALRARDARIRYHSAGEEWDARSWFNYWIEKSGMVVRHEGPYESGYDELVQKFVPM